MLEDDLIPSGQGGSIATARWADPDYIADRYYFQPGDIWIGRNPHNYDQAIGYRDSRHVLVCAGTRSGKGRSFIVNNLALWPGSTVTYDPKGELPAILAPRRGEGNQYCDGMGQDVFVLDPLNHADVDDCYRAYFDPLSGLDPQDKDGELVTWAKRIASSLIEFNEGTESGEWGKRAIRLVTLIIMHVLTSKLIEDKDRNLMTVLRLLMEGSVDVFEAMKARLPREKWASLPDPMAILIDEMIENDACRGWIASDARSLKRQAERTPKFFESVRGEATDKLDWFKSAGIERSLCGWDDPDRHFDPKRLKSDPNGVSVFIVMPTDDLKTYGPWLQTVFTGIFAAMRQVRGSAASGHQTLCVLDEFSSLGYQDYISTSLDSIAGAGMKLAIIVQNFGKMKKLYGDEIESFFTNSGLELYFGKIGQTAAEHVQNVLGQTEIVRLSRSQNYSQNQSESISDATTFGETSSEGGSETLTETTSTARSKGKSWNWSKAVNWSDSNNWGRSNGRTMGENYGPHIFFEGFEKSTSYGTNLSNNWGGSHTSGGSRVRGGARSEQITRTKGESRAKGSSWQQSTTQSQTSTTSQSQGSQFGEGVSETFHKKPLLELHEMNRYLRVIEEEFFDHPAYPGMALALVQGEEPFFVRRSNYDQDQFLERCFHPDTSFKFVPASQRRPLGFEYDRDHIFIFDFPEELKELGCELESHVRKYETVSEGDLLFNVSSYFSPVEQVYSGFDGRVMRIAEASEPNFFCLRSFDRLTARKIIVFRANNFGSLIESANAEMERLDAEKSKRMRQQYLENQARLEKEREEEELEEQAREKRGMTFWMVYQYLCLPFVALPVYSILIAGDGYEGIFLKEWVRWLAFVPACILGLVVVSFPMQGIREHFLSKRGKYDEDKDEGYITKAAFGVFLWPIGLLFRALKVSNDDD